MLSIVFIHSPLWLLLIVPLAAAFSGWYYFYKSEFKRPQSLLLASLRFLLLLGLASLLLQPQWQSENFRTEKPLLLWLEDRSESMTAAADSAAVREFWRYESPTLREALREKYALRPFEVAEKLTPLGDSLSTKTTSLSTVLSEAQGSFFKQNVAAAVLISDGIYNRGGHPQAQARHSPFPIYSLHTGDTQRRRDAAIRQIDYNRTAMLGRRFPLEVALEAQALAGEKLVLRLLDSRGRTLESRRIAVQQSDFFQKEIFYLQSDSLGLHSYSLQWEVPAGDSNPANNRRSFSVEVLEYSKKIALVSTGVHPDIGALQTALSSEQRYKLEVFSPGLLPTEPADLYLLHRPDAALLKAVLATGKPYLMIGDATSDWPAVAKNWSGASRLSREAEESFAYLAPNFVRFQLTEGERELFQSLPPLAGIYGAVSNFSPDGVLLYKRLGRVETDLPLLFLQEQEQVRSAYLLGEGLWRWRIYNYKRHKNFAAFDGLVQKVARYLMSGGSQERFSLEVAPRHPEGLPVDFLARLLNRSGELTVQGGVDLRLYDQDQQELQYQFSAQDPVYRLSLKGLAEGSYRYRAEAQLGDERFRKTGNFVVEPNRLEYRDLRARPSVLQAVSEQSGGAAYPLAQTQALREALLALPAPSLQYRELNTEPILSQWWIYFVFLAFAASEWLLRKYWGSL